MRPGFLVGCVESGAVTQARGPFDTREEALAELTLVQQNYLIRCDLDHHILPTSKAAADMPVYPPLTTEVERRQQIARSAAMRASR